MLTGSVIALVVKLGGDRVMPVRVMALVPVLEMVTVCAALVVPTF